jgi:hypothetical protein
VKHQTKKGKNNMPTNTKSNTKQGPGRPEAKVLWPKGKFTFLALCILNGATDATGKALPKKERRMCTLTLRNHLRRDMFKEAADGTLTPNPKSEIVIVKGEKGDVTAESGLGRKPLLYIRRSVAAASRKAKATVRKAKATVSVPVSDPAPAPATPIADPVTA